MHQYVSEGKTKIRGESPLETLRNFNAPSKRPHGFTFTWWRCSCLCLWHKPTELAHSFLFCSCVCFCLYGTFNCVSFHKFSRQLSAFSLCSTGLISALLVLSTILPLYESLPQPWRNPLWLTGLKAPTNYQPTLRNSWKYDRSFETSDVGFDSPFKASRSMTAPLRPSEVVFDCSFLKPSDVWRLL